jgi:hypothetical protein
MLINENICILIPWNKFSKQKTNKVAMIYIYGVGMMEYRLTTLH